MFAAPRGLAYFCSEDAGPDRTSQSKIANGTSDFQTEPPRAKWHHFLPNRRFYMPKTLVGSTTGGRVTYRVWRGGSLTAPSWTAAGGSSGLEFDTAATAFNAAGATLIVPFNLSNAVDAGRLDMTAYFEEHWTNAIRNLAFGGGQETITVTAQAAIGSVTVETHLAVDEVGA